MLELTKVAEAKSLEPNIKAHLILEIDGIDEVFGAYDVKRIAKIGDKGLLIGDDWKIGGVTTIPESRPYVSLTGSSQQLSQQLEQDKGGSGSIGSLTIELIDKADMITELISEQVTEDLLYRGATVYYAFKDTSHPIDSVKILSGVITDIKAKAGAYVFTIQHPEALKKTSLFTPGNSELVNAITNATTLIIIADPKNFPIEGPGYRYIKVDDEWILYNWMIVNENGTAEINAVKRGARGTIAAAHDKGASVSSAIEISGNTIDLSLQLLLSGRGLSPYQAVSAINQVSPESRIQNAICFNFDIKSKLGLVVGDTIKTDDSAINTTIAGFGQNEYCYYVTAAGFPLDTEATSEKQVRFKSKYDYYADGCAIPAYMVDIEEHEKLKSLYGNAFFDYTFFLTEEIEAQELINEQIYFPNGLYQLPRLGKVSLGITRAPLADSALKVDASNILNAQDLSVQRSVSKYFYNSVIYKYDKADEEDKYYGASLHYSADSAAKIKIGNRPLEIKCRGILRHDGLKTLMDSNATRFLNRYQFAADYIPKVIVNFKTGFKLDVGDCVLFGDPSLKIADMKAGSRSFEPRLMEIVNKKLDFKTGRVEIDLLDTNFEASGRYGVIAPSGIVSSMDSTSLTFGQWPLSKGKTAKQVWANYIGQHIEWHNDDWTRVGTGEIAGFDELNSDRMTIINKIGANAQAGDIASPMRYSSNEKIDRAFKSLFVFVNPTIDVLAGISSTKFTVANESLSFFKVGSPVILHKEDWSSKSVEVKVLEIAGNKITVPDLGFVPSNLYKIELIGFADGGAPYRVI